MRMTVFVLTIAFAIANFSPLRSVIAAVATNVYYVSPSGSNTNMGMSPESPFGTIQKALDLAQPGDTVKLAPGTYRQDVVSRRNGAASARITITGPSTAVIQGGGSARVFEINHDYLTLDGFSLDGLWGSSNRADGYRDKLLFVHGKEARRGVTGLKVRRITFQNSGGECVRFRYFAQANEVAESVFKNCGVHDYKFAAGGKNGEGIYIGTAPEQTGDGKNPTADPDQSNNNWIHHNFFNTQGNECVDIKEASTANIVEHNTCTGQKDPESGGLDARGSGNTFRYNVSYGNAGAGVRLGGDTEADGLSNHVYGNIIRDNRAGGIKFQRSSQARVCNNTMSNNVGGDAVGTYGARFDPTSPCSPGATSTPLPATPTKPAATATPNTTRTPTPLPTTPPSPPRKGCAYIVDGQAETFIESELFSSRSGRFTRLEDSKRSKGMYMAIPGDGMHEDPGTFLTFEIDVTKGGRFSVWLLGYGREGSGDSFFVQVGKGTQVSAHLSNDEWGWKEASKSISLEQGRHSFKIKNREDGARVDKILLTTDHDYTPTGMGATALKPTCR